MVSGRKLKHSIYEGILAADSGGNLWKDNFSAIANFVGSTDNRDQVINALRTLPGRNDAINVHELSQIMRGMKNNNGPAIMEYHLKSLSLHLSDC